MAPDIQLYLGLAFATVGLAVLVFQRGRRRPPPNSPAGREAAKARLKPFIDRAQAEIEALVRGRASIVMVTWIGAVDISPLLLAYWIFTTTDAERDRLQADPALATELREIVRRSGYPAEAIEHVGFAFESKETVDRDFGGNYWFAMK
jgi:hypothetical protein